MTIHPSCEFCALAASANLLVEFYNFHAEGVPSRLIPVGPADDQLREAVARILADEKAAVFLGCLGDNVICFVAVSLNETASVELEIWEFPAGPLRFYESLGFRTTRRTLACDYSTPATRL